MKGVFGATQIAILLLILAIYGLGAATGPILGEERRVDISRLFSDSLTRIGMNGVLVLSLLPTVVAGVGLNFGLPYGVIFGLLALLIVMQLGVTGIPGLLFAIGLAFVFGAIAGWPYGLLLNKVRGQEMMVGTYVGFAAVSLASIFWVLAPFSNPKMILPVGGSGLKTTLPLSEFGLEKVLDRTGVRAVATSIGLHTAGPVNKFAPAPMDKIGSVSVPTGTLLVLLLFAYLIARFLETPLGQSLRTTGANERFASMVGLDPDRIRLAAVMLSTGLAAAGIVVYSQSFALVQLYTAPLMMAFPAVAALLIGGASLERATVSQALLGTVLFQTLLTSAPPVANTFLPADVSEIARMIIANGMILYALARSRTA